MKSNKIKTEDIIKSLRVCYTGLDCVGCMFEPDAVCDEHLMRLAADRLEQQEKRLGEMIAENKLLRDN